MATSGEIVTDYDAFNGDADGICALIQLRLSEPRDSIAVTGVKRDIALLEKISAKPDDRVTVLDVSLDKNRGALTDILGTGASVFYVDHHFAGEIPEQQNLDTIINTAPDVCTSMLVNGHLKGAHVGWAIVGAFGDNLRTSALALAKPLGLDDSQLDVLERLGIYINYNGYGASIEDLHFPPAELYALLSAYSTPLEFIAQDSGTFEMLENGYTQDMAAARQGKAILEKPHAAVYMLPDEPWARRVSGVYGNDLANEHPQRAHAIVTERQDQGYLVSIRAPLSNKVGADEICRQFPTGGGRKAAAGINDLPRAMLEQFVEVFTSYYEN